MEDDFKLSQHSGDSVTINLPGMVIAAAIFVFLFVLVFVLLLQLYAKLIWAYIDDLTPLPPQTRPRRRFEFSAVQDPNSGKGLDAAVLRSLPVLIFHSDDFKDALECAVCLSELVDGEKAKLLHGCSHGFHSDCIDMWFQSHSTCPLCRNPVTAAVDPDESPEEGSAPGLSSESPTFPTNVLIWGNQVQIASAGASSSAPAPESQPDAELAIDVQSDIQFPPSELNEDGKLQIPTRLRSLKRLLSRQRRLNLCNSNSACVEMEQLA